MKKRLKKVIILISFIFIFLPIIVNADSGYDSDYGSSDNSFGSSSYNNDYSSNQDTTNSELLIFMVFIIVEIAFIIGVYIMKKREIKKFTELKDKDNKSDVVLNRNYNGNRDLGLDSNPYVGDYDEEIKKYFPEMDEKLLIKRLVNIFIDIQEAWMLFDYDSLKKLCSTELYNSYKSDLEVLKNKDEQNIMDDFKLEACNVKEIKEENGLIVIKLYVHLVFRDYIVNTKTGDIVRGDYNRYVHNQYSLEYVISKNAANNTCPNCGAKFNDNVNECNYCHTVINNKYNDFVLNVKKVN